MRSIKDSISLFRDKKGQGLSLTVIIVAAIALIVLVVLIMVFTGRIGVFSEGIDKAGDSDLVEMRVQYGDCHPSATSEATFTIALSAAESSEAQSLERAKFKDEINRCKSFSNDKGVCESETGCVWE